jgi:photosystem II stability/assembly factor-like uncharacterized protein
MRASTAVLMIGALIGACDDQPVEHPAGDASPDEASHTDSGVESHSPGEPTDAASDASVSTYSALSAADCDPETGSPWSYVPATAPGGLSWSLAATTHAAGVLIASSRDLTGPFLAISTNGGGSWCRRRAGTRSLGAIARSPVDPELVYSYQGDQVVRSRDGGRTWDLRGRVGYAAAPSLTLSERDPSALLACTQDSGLALADIYCSLSTDGGATFAKVVKPPALANVRVISASSTSQPSARVHLLATTTSTPGTVELRVPTNGFVLSGPPDALVQHALPAPLKGFPQIHAFDGGEIVILHAGGVLASRDGGATWVVESTDTTWVASAREPGRLWAVGPAGTFHSTDRAKSWHRVGDPPEDLQPMYQTRASRLVLSGAPATEAYLQVSSRLLRFAGTPPSWRLTYVDFEEAQIIVTGSAEPTFWGRLERAYIGWSRSYDFGKTWTPVPESIRHSTLGVHVIDRARIVIVGYWGSDQLQRVQFSDDGGRTFEAPISCRLVQDSTLPPPSDAYYSRGSLGSTSSTEIRRVGAPNTREFYARVGKTLLRSNQDGTICTPLINGPSELTYPWWIAPSDPNRGYAIGFSGTKWEKLVVTRDGWRTWSSVDPELSSSFNVTVDPMSADTVYACNNQRCRRSVDGGTTWTTILDVGSPQGAPESSYRVIVDPLRPSVLYMSRNGVQRSRDSGITWERLDGDPAPAGGSLWVDAFDGGFVWAASGHGLMRRLND